MTNACDRSVKVCCSNQLSSAPQLLSGSGDYMKSAITAVSNSDRWTSVLRATGIQMLGTHAGRQAGYTLSGTISDEQCSSWAGRCEVPLCHCGSGRPQAWTGRAGLVKSQLLQSQLREAKLLWPRSLHVCLLQRRYQTHLRHSRTNFAQREVVDFLQLLRTNPRKFWQAARLPNVLLPQELHDPAVWDSFLSKLTAPSAQHATQLPAPHMPQAPAPAHSLNQPLTLAEVRLVCNSCTMAGQGPCMATPQSFCVMPSLWPHRMIQSQLTCWHLALWCCSMLPSAQSKCPSPGRTPWSPNFQAWQRHRDSHA